MEWISKVESASQELQRQLVSLDSDRMTNGDEVLERLFEADISTVSCGNGTVHEMVYATLQRLVHMVSYIDRNLSGVLVGVGSYFDGTQVGAAPNDFDYIYELTQISSGLEMAQHHGLWEYRFKAKPGSSFTSVSRWLSNILVRDRLYTLIDHVMKIISLPTSLHHGGILSPCFSGIRKNGPAFTLLFAWSGGPYEESPLLISVDITVGIRPHHLRKFTDEQTRLVKLATSVGGQTTDAHRLYVIAHPDRDDVWQMTTAALEVDIMSRISNRITGVVMKLKVLKNLFLTITEGGDIEHRHCFVDHNDDIFETTRRLQSMVKVANAKARSKPWTAKKRREHSADTPVGRSACKFEDNEDATVDMEKAIQCVMEIQQCWFRQIKRLESLKSKIAQRDRLSPKHETVPDEYQKVASLIHKLCCTYLKNSARDLTSSGESGKGNLDYLADILPPYLCKIAMEYHKPTITLKSCVFKYIVIGALLSGELPQCFTDEGEDIERNDLQAIVLGVE